MQDPTTQDWSFDLSLATTLGVCEHSSACNKYVFTGAGCSTTDCSSFIPAFSDTETASLTVDGGGNNVVADIFDPIGFTFVSTGPATFTSSTGLQSPPGPAAVPEPASISILLAGLAALAWRRRHPLRL